MVVASPPRAERVHVHCRLKPVEDGQPPACEAEPEDGGISLAMPDQRTPKTWTFDGIHGPESTQASMYDAVAVPVLESVLQGYNGTILAYGQTGSGKTYTLLNGGGTVAKASRGGRSTAAVADAVETAGLVPRLIAELFVSISCDVRHVYTVSASFAQIYNEQARARCERASAEPGESSR